jgi:hypothetical protein
MRDELSASDATVCLYRGEFHTPTGPPDEDGSAKANHNLLRLIVLDDGMAIFDSAGYEGQMKPETPGDWRRATE